VNPSDKTTHEPIAIVGIGCRYADARGPDEFWEIVRSGRNTVRDVPQHRIELGYDIDHFYDPRPRIPGKVSSKKGGFLEHPELFDAEAFGIAPRDALTMEPQQRLMIEVTWDALEDAGIVPASLMGERVAVILGYMAEDYSRERTGVLGEAAVFRGHDVFTVGGMSHAVLTGRIAFLLGVTGPSFTLDTACSSSLITTHLACESIRRGESRMAIAGGVNVFLSPEGNIALSRSGMLSMSGACKAFDSSADGFVRAEGAGVVVLRPLSDAIVEGNNIYAVIRGSGISSDGRDGGHMMAPGRKGQAQAMRDAYTQAGVSPSDVDYVETHGTGTLIGDPVEIAALADVMGPGRSPDRPLRVASVKGNLGHTESASGVAGLIKTALAIRHRELPAQLHFKTPNPVIPWDEIPIRVQSESSPWPGTGPALAGVNSFGISGTNAHIVLESPPEVCEVPEVDEALDEKPVSRDAARPLLLPITGHDPKSMHAMVEAQREQLRERPDLRLEDLAHSLGLRRTHRAHRFAVVARTREELASELDAYLADHPSAAVQVGVAPAAGPPKIVMVFPGQGGQWLGMGRELLEREPVFAAAIDALDTAYHAHVDWSLRDMLEGTDAIDWTKRLDVLQPVLVAMEIALAALWASWGIRPDRVIGQSMGEIAAAHVAGGLDIEDVARLACHRGIVVARASGGRGAMAVVSLSREGVEKVIEARATGDDQATTTGRVEIAGSNSPRTTIVSGDREAIMELVAGFEARGVFARRLKVDFASHCFHMDPLLDDFRDAIRGIEPREIRIPFDSTVDGETKSGAELDAGYWVRNLREPVAFDRGVASAIEAGGEIFIEVSPHPTLPRALDEIAGERGEAIVHVASLQREQAERRSLVTSLGRLFTLGVEVDFAALQPAGRFVATPLYAYQRKRFWFSDRNRLDHFRPVHPLLGARSQSSIDPRLHSWDFMLDADSAGFIQDYRVAGEAGAPAGLYPELALAVAEAIWPGLSVTIRDLEIVRPLLLGPTGRHRVQVVLCAAGEGAGELRISSRTDDRSTWDLHATGLLRPRDEESITRGARVLDRSGHEALSSEPHLASLERCGVVFGPKCKTLRELECIPVALAGDEGVDGVREHGDSRDGHREEGRLAKMMLPRVCESEWFAYHAHPALLEGCFQLLGTFLDRPAAVRVLKVGEVALQRTLGSDCWCRIRTRGSTTSTRLDRTDGIVEADLEFFDRDGAAIGRIEGVRAQALPERVEQTSARAADGFALEWIALDLHAVGVEREIADIAESKAFRGAASRIERWIVLSSSTDEVGTLAAELQKQGATCHACTHVEDLEPLVRRLEREDARAWGLVVLSGEDPSSLSNWTAAVCDDAHDAEEIWIVTRGLHSIRAEAPSRPTQARGFAREIDDFASRVGARRGDSSFHHFDASDEPGHFEGISLATLLGRAGGDRLFVAHGEEVHVPRLSPTAVAAAWHEDPHKSATVLAGSRNFRAVHSGDEGLACLRLDEIAEPELESGTVLVEVASVGLSQLDVLTGFGLARGAQAQMQPVARDFSGIVLAVSDSGSDFRVGDEVMGVREGALARRMRVSAARLARKPAFFDFAEASSVPFPFLVARYALQIVARLRAGERVLILSAAGGVGQALIQVARELGAEVSVTASTDARRAHLRTMGARVLDADPAAASAGDSGVDGLGEFDVIVSGDAGPSMHRLLARLAAGGRYLDLCPRTGFERPELGTLRLGANRSVSSIDVGEMMRTEPTLVAALLEQIAEDAREGRLQSIPMTVFGVAEVARALRYMAQNRHAGRVIVDLAEARSAPVRPLAGASHALADRGGFIVTGPDSAIREAIVDWLRTQSADPVVDLGSGDLAATVAELEARGHRLGGWIELTSGSGHPDEEPNRHVRAANAADFRASITLRESTPDRGWETHLFDDRVRLASEAGEGRCVHLSVEAEAAPERVVEWLARAIFSGVSGSQVVVFDADELSRRLDGPPSPLFSQLRRGSEIRDRSQLLRAELGSLSATERRTTMQRFVLDALAGVLGLSDEQRSSIDFGRQLDSLGLDSLMTMELFMGMGRDLQLQIAADWFESIPSLADIATVLVERLEEAVSAQGAS
jgi:acyl transferase domain-containing protein/NADPH:quinone reductase-like Zn-dependent oxidoreductase/acyl carrier protein